MSRVAFKFAPRAPFTFGMTDRDDGSVWFVVADPATERLKLTTEQPYENRIEPHIHSPFGGPMVGDTGLRIFVRGGLLGFEEIGNRRGPPIKPYAESGGKADPIWTLIRGVHSGDARLGYDTGS